MVHGEAAGQASVAQICLSPPPSVQDLGMPAAKADLTDAVIQRVYKKATIICISPVSYICISDYMLNWTKAGEKQVQFSKTFFRERQWNKMTT
jgi:hypothetical protein